VIKEASSYKVPDYEKTQLLEKQTFWKTFIKVSAKQVLCFKKQLSSKMKRVAMIPFTYYCLS
jgi:hypothetical protein